jgi:ankyrin repeat protein
MRPVEYINKQGFLGCTALIASRNAEMAQLLLEQGADPRIVDNDGRTALMMPVGSAARARLLLNAAPDLIHRRDSTGQGTVAYLSCFVHGCEALEELFRYCEEHDIDIGKNSKDNGGDTALHQAMYWENTQAVKLLLEKGVEILDQNNEGKTVLMNPLKKEQCYSSGRYYQDDIKVNECLRLVLDAVLQHGDAGAAGMDAGVHDEPVAKRRRVSKE